MDTRQNILVYTDGEVIGDGMIRLPFAKALKQAAQQKNGSPVHLTWLASGYSVYGDVLKEMADPIIDELIILPDRRIPLSEYLLGPRILRNRYFDVIIDLQRNFKRAWWLSRISHRVFISAAGNYMLSSRKPAPSQHYIPRFIHRICKLGEMAIGAPLTPAPLSTPAEHWRHAAAQYLPADRHYMGYVVGAGHPEKCWPLADFIALAQTWQARGYIPVFLLGPKEQEQAAQIRAALPEAKIPLLDAAQIAVPAESPYFTIAVSERLAACVANDSGGGHLTAAGGAPMLSLFRSRPAREKFMPSARKIIALTPEDFALTRMQEIPLAAVSDALARLLTTSG